MITALKVCQKRITGAKYRFRMVLEGLLEDLIFKLGSEG